MMGIGFGPMCLAPGAQWVIGPGDTALVCASAVALGSACCPTCPLQAVGWGFPLSLWTLDRPSFSGGHWPVWGCRLRVLPWLAEV